MKMVSDALSDIFDVFSWLKERCRSNILYVESTISYTYHLHIHLILTTLPRIEYTVERGLPRLKKRLKFVVIQHLPFYLSPSYLYLLLFFLH